jgi:hypothetical protein
VRLCGDRFSLVRGGRHEQDDIDSASEIFRESVLGSSRSRRGEIQRDSDKKEQSENESLCFALLGIDEPTMEHVSRSLYRAVLRFARHSNGVPFSLSAIEARSAASKALFWRSRKDGLQNNPQSGSFLLWAGDRFRMVGGGGTDRGSWLVQQV